MRSSCRSSSPKPRLSPNCSTYVTRRSEWPFLKFCFESILRASENNADLACSSMYFLRRNRVWIRPSKSQLAAELGQISIAPASRPRWMSHRSGEGLSKTTGVSWLRGSFLIWRQSSKLLVSGKLSYSRTKSGCISWQHRTADSPSASAVVSHFWFCKKNFSPSRFAEITSTSKTAGLMLPSLLVRKGGLNTPLLSRDIKFLFEGLVLPAISNPCGRRTPASASRGREGSSVLGGVIVCS